MHQLENRFLECYFIIPVYFRSAQRNVNVVQCSVFVFMLGYVMMLIYREMVSIKIQRPLFRATSIKGVYIRTSCKLCAPNHSQHATI